jgi:hypothetical protein
LGLEDNPLGRRDCFFVHCQLHQVVTAGFHSEELQFDRCSPSMVLSIVSLVYSVPC